MKFSILVLGGPARDWGGDYLGTPLLAGGKGRGGAACHGLAELLDKACKYVSTTKEAQSLSTAPFLLCRWVN